MTKLMAGKRGLIMGLANDRSLAWGIAQQLAEHGAELAFSYQGEALEKRVRPLAEQLGSNLLVDCDVSNMEALDRTFAELVLVLAEFLVDRIRGELGDHRTATGQDAQE